MRGILFLWLVLISPVVFAQQDPDRVNLSSPYHALNYYFDNMQDDNYNPVRASRVFNPAYIKDINADNLAEELKQVIDGRGIYIELESLPKDPNYVDSTTNRSQYYFGKPEYEQLYLEKSGNQWLFSRRTTEAIDNLHKETFPYGTDKLLNLLPKIGNNKILGLKLWQYLVILILVFASFIIHFILKNLLRGFINKTISRVEYFKDAKGYVSHIVIPLSYAIVLQMVKTLIPIIQLPANISHYLTIIIGALVPLGITIALFRVVDIISLYFEKLAETTKSTLDDQLVPLVRKSLKTFVVIIGVLFILQNLQIDIVPLLAGLSIGGLAFALAAQDTLKNFFGSLMIFIDKPFQVGHWITSGDIDGTVEEVGFRSTRIRTFRNSLVYVPNGKIADSTVDNHGLREYRRFFTTIGVTYDTPADLIELFVQGLKKLVDEHPHTRKDFYEIHFNDMGSSSLNIMFYIFFKVPTWTDELRCRHEILLSIMKLAEELGVNFAFPTQTLHVENFPGQLSLSPTYGQRSDLEKKMDNFLKENKKNFKQ